MVDSADTHHATLAAECAGEDSNTINGGGGISIKKDIKIVEVELNGSGEVSTTSNNYQKCKDLVDSRIRADDRICELKKSTATLTNSCP